MSSFNDLSLNNFIEPSISSCQLLKIESKNWSGILLPWVFETFSSDTIRSSAIKILCHILEKYGTAGVPLSQGWLAMTLSKLQSSMKKSNDKGTE